MRAALLQISSSDDPAGNTRAVSQMIGEAAAQGAKFVLTPEVTNCVSLSRTYQSRTLHLEQDDSSLAALRALAEELGIWLSMGSLAVKTGDADGRFANRSFLIGPDGAIVGRYDKIHMFDVDVTPTETFRESDAYRPGTEAVIAKTSFATIGMSICYDVRFAYLYRALAQAGAEIMLVPAAFSPVTGAAHWEPLLRARAIETGSFVMAAGQTGTHKVSTDKTRSTYGHSMVVSPWGEVLLDAGTDVGVHVVDIDLAEVSAARQKIAALTHDRPFSGP